MLRRFVEHGFIGRDSILDAILLQESLGAIQMFADVLRPSAAVGLCGLS